MDFYPAPLTTLNDLIIDKDLPEIQQTDGTFRLNGSFSSAKPCRLQLKPLKIVLSEQCPPR